MKPTLTVSLANDWAGAQKSAAARPAMAAFLKSFEANILKSSFCFMEEQEPCHSTYRFNILKIHNIYLKPGKSRKTKTYQWFVFVSSDAADTAKIGVFHYKFQPELPVFPRKIPVRQKTAAMMR